MKAHTSRLLKSLAWIYLTFPITYVFFCAVVFNISVWAGMHLLLSPMFYLVSAAVVIAGYGLREMKRWSWYVFLLANILIAYENAVIVNAYGETHYKSGAFLFSIALLGLITYWVAREIRVPYFFPRIRWWESDPRYRLSVPVQVARGSHKDNLVADIMDLSMGGCFIKIRTELTQDEHVAIEFTVFQIQLRCEGMVVWRTQSTVTHPKGVGIKFAPLSKEQRRTLRAITQRLKRISTFYRRSRYLLNQDEFVKKLQELETMPLQQKTRRARVS